MAAAEVSPAALASPMSWQPRRRARPTASAPRRYTRDELLALAPKATFPAAVLRSAPEVLACSPIAAILSTPAATPLASTPLSTPGSSSPALSASSPLLRAARHASPASPSSPLSVSSPSPSPAAVAASPRPRAVETDEHRLAQRAKQIEYGKRTQGYQNYVAQVPRKRRTAADPRTPDATQRCSKRAWDGQVRKWRRLLHAFDDAAAASDDSSGAEPAAVDSLDDDSADAASSSGEEASPRPLDVGSPLAARLEQLSLAPLPVALAAH